MYELLLKSNPWKIKKSHVISGRKPVREALSRGYAIEKILLERGKEAEIIEEIKKLAKNKSIPCQEVDRALFQQHVQSKNHQGVAALTYQSPRVYEDPTDFLKEQGESIKRMLFIALDQITDPHNLGAISRSAYFMGVDLIVLEKKNSPSLTETVHKVAAGASLFLSYCYVGSLRLVLENLKKQSFQIIGSWTESPSYDIKEVSFQYPLVLVLGSEGAGIRKNIKRLCDSGCHIPSHPFFDSLNVSVAAGILLHELRKGRPP